MVCPENEKATETEPQSPDCWECSAKSCERCEGCRRAMCTEHLHSDAEAVPLCSECLTSLEEEWQENLEQLGPVCLVSQKHHGRMTLVPANEGDPKLHWDGVWYRCEFCLFSLFIPNDCVGEYIWSEYIRDILERARQKREEERTAATGADMPSGSWAGNATVGV